MDKLAIISSHPIQYYAPLFKELSREIELKVFYCYNPNADEIGKEGFGESFKWDVDLMEGYEYEFMQNRAAVPSVSHFAGCDVPDIHKYIESYGATHVVVFGWYLKAFRQALKYCNQKKIPIAVRGDSKIDPTQALWKRVLKKIYYPFFLKKFDAFLFVGQKNKEYLKNYSVGEKKLIFSPHAVDQDFWKGEKPKKDKIVFLWVAKFIPLKRPEDVLKAFMALSGEHLELRLVGSGELLEESKKIAAKDSRIKFLGFKNQKNLRSEYLLADVLILSSSSETWGLVVNEAYASENLAILSSAVGCSPDLQVDPILNFKMGNADDLSRALRSSLERISDLTQLTQLKKLIREKNTIYSYQTNVNSFKTFIKDF